MSGHRLSPELRRFQEVGIPPGKAKRLMKAFGSVERVLAANLDTLTLVPGISRSTARQVLRIRKNPPAAQPKQKDARQYARALLSRKSPHHLNPAAIARLTGLSYAHVRKLAEPLRQQQRAEWEKRAEEHKRREEEQLRQPQPADVVCRCGRFLKVTQKSVTVEVLQADAPDRLWAGSIYTCPECGQEVITGFSRRPIAEQGEPSYAQQRERLAPLYIGLAERPEQPHTQAS